MRLNLRTTAARRRALTMAIACIVLLVVAGSLARASGAGSTAVSTPAAAHGYPLAEAGQPWAYQRFLVSGQADMDQLDQMGVDLGESLDKNKDGTMWAYAVVTAAQRNYLAKLGFRPGSIVQTSLDAEKARAEMADTSHREMRALRLAKSHIRVKHAFAGETLKITRADYYQSLSGTWLSVEAKSSAAQGNAAVPPGSPGCPTTGSNRCGINGGSHDRRMLGQPGRRGVRAEHGRLPGARGDVLHRRRRHVRPRLPDPDAGRPRRRGLPLPLPAHQAGPQGQRRDRAAPADPGQGRVELRQRPDAAGDVVRRHAAAVPGRLPARLLHALPDARGRHGDDPGAARAVPEHHAADPGDLQDERLPPERDGLDGLHRLDQRRQHRPSGHARRVAGRLRDAGHLHGHHGAERRGRPEHLEVR